MTKERIEDLFSPERLRDSWSEEEESTAGAEQDEHPARPADDHPVGLAQRLEEIVRARFPGDPEPAIQALVSRLRSLVERRFPQQEGREDPEDPEDPQEDQETQDQEDQEDQAALDQEIAELLGQIEDLAEAWTLGERRR